MHVEWVRQYEAYRLVDDDDQLALVERLVRHARELPFYADRLACLFGSDDSFDFSRWQDVPILSRAEVVENVAHMRAPSLPPFTPPAVPRD